MFHVLQTIVRNGQWQEDIVAKFATESEAVEFAKRCHNGNPTTVIKDEKSGKVFTSHWDTNGTTLLWQTGPIH